jgi:hypothetical protein
MLKISEQDDFNEGITGKANLSSINCRLQADTIPQLLKNALEFCGATKGDLTVNACDEAGRVDICTMEDRNGNSATTQQVDAWKFGRETLYACTYTFGIYKVEPVTALGGALAAN